MLKSDQMY